MLLSSIYPEYEWLPWRFLHLHVAKGFWDDVKNQRDFMDWAGKKLNYKSREDWYGVTAEVINFFKLNFYNYFEGYYKVRRKRVVE